MERNKYTSLPVESKLSYFLFFATKNNRKVLVGDVKGVLHNSFIELLNDKNIKITELSIFDNGVSLIVSNVTPDLSPAKIVSILKRGTNGLIRNKFPLVNSRLPTLWTRSFFAQSIGSFSEKALISYKNSVS